MNKNDVLHFLTCILCMCILLSFMGCGEQLQNQGDENKEDASAPLIIFYEDCENLLENFELSYPEISFEAYSMSSKDLDEDGLEGLIRKEGYPDLVLSNGEEAIEELIELGVVDSMDNLLDEDISIQYDNYFPGTFDVGVLDDSVYALPVSVKMHYMIMRESEWQNSAFADMPEEYTIGDLLTAMETELDAEKETGYQNFYNEATRPVEWLASSGMVHINEESVEVSSEGFEQMMRVLCKQTFNEAELVQNDEVWSEFPAINPTAYCGQYLAACWGNRTAAAAPQVGMVYAYSAVKEWYGEEIRVVFRPSETAGEYGVCVQTMGMIGAKSEIKDEAYDALRKMMDMTPLAWKVPGKNDAGKATYCPVNIKCAKELLDCVEETGDKSIWIPATNQAEDNGFWASKQKLSEKLHEQLLSYIDSVSFVYRLDPHLYSEEINNQMLFAIYDSQQEGVIQEDYSACYELVNWLLEQNIG